MREIKDRKVSSMYTKIKITIASIMLLSGCAIAKGSEIPMNNESIREIFLESQEYFRKGSRVNAECKLHLDSDNSDSIVKDFLSMSETNIVRKIFLPDEDFGDELIIHLSKTIDGNRINLQLTIDIDISNGRCKRFMLHYLL